MAVLTSKITAIDKRCKIFELTKVNLLSLFELVFNNDALVLSWASWLAVCYPLFFNGMPIVVLRVVRLTPTISVSETVRSSARSVPGWIMD